MMYSFFLWSLTLFFSRCTTSLLLTFCAYWTWKLRRCCNFTINARVERRLEVLTSKPWHRYLSTRPWALLTRMAWCLSVISKWYSTIWWAGYLFLFFILGNVLLSLLFKDLIRAFHNIIHKLSYACTFQCTRLKILHIFWFGKCPELLRGYLPLAALSALRVTQIKFVANDHHWTIIFIPIWSHLVYPFI